MGSLPFGLRVMGVHFLLNAHMGHLDVGAGRSSLRVCRVEMKWLTSPQLVGHFLLSSS